jgi:hypothetical protein
MCRRCGKTRTVSKVVSGMPVAAAPKSVDAAIGLLHQPMAEVAPASVPRAPRQATRGRMLPPVSRNRVEEDRKVADSTRVKVIENSGNRGGHSVIGVATRTNYGKKRHGQRFMMDIRDQRAQPHLYILAPEDGKKPTRMAARPAPPKVNRVTRPPAPPVKAQPVEQPATVPEMVEEAVYNVDRDGIDVSVLPVRAIKELGLEGEEAADAYILEEEGRARKSVLAYLRSRPGIDDFLEFDDEEMEE